MNKELQKLLKQINDKKNEVKSLVNDGKLDKAKTAKEELKELQNRFSVPLPVLLHCFSFPVLQAPHRQCFLFQFS